MVCLVAQFLLAEWRFRRMHSGDRACENSTDQQRDESVSAYVHVLLPTTGHANCLPYTMVSIRSRPSSSVGLRSSLA